MIYIAVYFLMAFISYGLFAWTYKVRGKVDKWWTGDYRGENKSYITNMFYCGFFAPFAFIHSIFMTITVFIHHDIKLFKKL